MPPAPDTVPYLDFAIALFLGALVGVEREKSRPETEGGIAGIRTFTLFALTGALGGWLSVRTGSPWILAAAVASVTALVVAGYVAHVRIDPKARGLTTEIAAVVVCLLGAAVTTGNREIAVALGIVTSAMLAFRVAIHGTVARIGTADLYGGLKLLLASFVVLPLLPDRTIDPWDAINPYRTWWLVVLISGLSFLGYVAVRFLGPTKGFAVTGLLGGLVSSTAVTMTFARRSREEPSATALSGALASGVLLAWSVMFVRVVVTIAIVHPPLLASLWMPMSAMAAAALAVALLEARRPAAADATPDLTLRNPFSLLAAIKFALFYAAVLLVVRIVQAKASATGIYAVAALAGVADVDAITLSMAEFAKSGGLARTAAAAIAIAAIMNTVTKTGIVVALASPAVRNRVLVGAAAIFAAGGASLLLA